MVLQIDNSVIVKFDGVGRAGRRYESWVRFGRAAWGDGYFRVGCDTSPRTASRVKGHSSAVGVG